MKTTVYLLAATFAVFLSACKAGTPADLQTTAAPKPAAEPTAMEPTVSQSSFRVIAYVTAAVVPEVIPYDRLTHINYSFLIPNADGSFVPLSNSWKLKKIVSQAHEDGVEVLISVGGWGWDEQFETMAADPETRAVFVDNLSAFVDEFDLDGADIDWEYPDPGQSAENFLLLIEELREAMPDKLLTTAVVAYGVNGEGVPGKSFDLFDFVNLMTYDGPDHGTMEQFQKGIDYWQGRGLEPGKTVMGVPFYSEPANIIYRKIVEADSAAADRDTTDHFGTTIHYNGRPTIREKTRLAMEEAGGIMFWTLEQDAMDELSLVKTIDDAVAEFGKVE